MSKTGEKMRVEGMLFTAMYGERRKKQTQINGD